MPGRSARHALARLHRLNAAFFGAYLLIHFSNHLAALAGPGAHLAVMDALRTVYRNPVIEPLLFASGAVQIGSGLTLAWRAVRRGLPEGLWPRLQVISGAYIALFLLQHFFAVIRARLLFPEVDTNVWWAASVVSEAPLAYYFVPYYALGPLAVGLHVGAAARFALTDRGRPTSGARAGWTLAALGGAIGGLTVAALTGTFHDFSLPAPYRGYLEAFGL
ncbi:hypothetical protein P1J78_10060 [Psychromarinibacter sp. C21-152]|uniref:Uncharacterized protein n=1 Tax=Psychromarinibacter sediminicola TaxID=3033385 RepID=A0AAE3T9J0_9RHOB|nr:hypothetical protein [Psychromarinibacter sediminicola]MDF0601074.1 hypothetical protein [Psychromarinibacter sediminicola]